MELLLGFLQRPASSLRPVIELLQRHIEPMRDTIQWGPLLPYNITGQLNRHPRDAIRFLDGNDRTDYVRFFDETFDDGPAPSTRHSRIPPEKPGCNCTSTRSASVVTG